MIRTILVVDDSPTERFMTVDILSKAGYQVLTAENAEEGIVKAKTMHPDLIVMDVVMPGMNGYQATRTLKKTEETKDIPIIVCTSKGQETDKIWGIRQGASDYLVKPVKAQELLQHIAALGGRSPEMTIKSAAIPNATSPAKIPVMPPKAAAPAAAPAAVAPKSPAAPAAKPTATTATPQTTRPVSPQSVAPASVVLKTQQAAPQAPQVQRSAVAPQARAPQRPVAPAPQAQRVVQPATHNNAPNARVIPKPTTNSK